ncbi:flagellar basal body rod protein FlgC [Metabacillus sp. RGM 3146]|uniref:flagellar basal body rod protein FlgC n=1 Tax=Metabacillus sp. RGM 3146 TaxID=3401092 RepID=UPI003B9CD6BE
MIFGGLDTTASALTTQRLRMDVVSSNMANADTTRAEYVNGKWQPYRRKMVETQPLDGNFSSFLDKAMNNGEGMGGVKATGIVEDQTPFKMVYDPENPDANQQGYAAMPNVDPLKEMVDLISSTRSYEANVTVFNASKGMLMKALEIGK